MKALTVQQPWAWAIMHGGKRIENRTQLWKYRGPLAIHAGKRCSERGRTDGRVASVWFDHPSTDWADLDFSGYPEAEAFTYGAILGTVDLVDVHPDAGCCRPWGESAYVEHGGRERRCITHLVLEDPRPLAVPIGCTGALGLWTPPSDVLEQLAGQVPA